MLGLALESRGSGRVLIGHEALGLIIGCSRSAVQGACVQLEDSGLIERDGPKVDTVQPYRILYPGYETTIKRESPPLKTVPMQICPSCGQKCRRLPSKWPVCKTCRWNAKVDRRIEAKLKH